MAEEVEKCGSPKNRPRLDSWLRVPGVIPGANDLEQCREPVIRRAQQESHQVIQTDNFPVPILGVRRRTHTLHFCKGRAIS